MLDNKISFIKKNTQLYEELKEWYQHDYLPEKKQLFSEQQMVAAAVQLKNKKIKEQIERIESKMKVWRHEQ